MHCNDAYLVLFTITKMWKQPKCPLVAKWIERCDMWICVCAYLGVDAYIRVCVLACVSVWNISHKNEIVPFATT